ncbi:6-phosphogluconolactonase [Pseudonocardia sp. KRD291]|uniref:6-phosphogluconolactonase n=1 Tax=Pseudonocardia sp. KRD291 TaxID=2792007 RepID=UPI001C49DD3D|nr:6-phosphogluconolactonase [Pseudonocardia sp. KRD291]MBW0105458.1 6-phosphogluconolactonase [Pseudonocardia sp. KRD291]
MSDTEIDVHPDADALAAAVAARLVTRLIDLQAAGRVPRVVLTGGGVGIDLLRKVRELPTHQAVDWSRVELFWGDERFVAPDDDERNDRQAREALLDHVALDPSRVHPMGADDGSGPSGAEKAAQDYADLLSGLAGAGAAVPGFDVVLLGMGGEGHTLSVFPDSPAVHETRPTVVAVHDCPKPPPDRVSLTLAVLDRAHEAWVVAAGGAKAEAVAGALGGAAETDVPVAGARRAGTTRWLLDTDAAAAIPGS